MSLEFTWLSEESIERVAEVRLRSFGGGPKDRQRYMHVTQNPIEPKPRDFLIASHDGQDVGTTCSINLIMWIRGAAIPCQGVGYVGTIKTHRRGGSGEKGLASQMMWQTLQKARERGHLVSALMPFRASYYEHFGYGVVEMRNEWTIPTGVFPAGDCAGFRFFEDSDMPALIECRNAIARVGQCDAERPEGVWRGLFLKHEGGFLFIDRPDANGPVQSWMLLVPEVINNKPGARIIQMGYASNNALRRQLHFLHSLQDQHHTAILSLPSDLPLNWLLRESMVPLNYPSHRVATVRSNTRMQIKILDHAKLLSAIHWPTSAKGSAVVRIHEPSGEAVNLKIDVEAGRATMHSSKASPQFECPERVWAPIACGELPAAAAVQLGLATGEPAAISLLDSLGHGKRPFCGEYF